MPVIVAVFLARSVILGFSWRLAHSLCWDVLALMARFEALVDCFDLARLHSLGD